MKKKDLVYLVLAVVIFLVAGYVAYTQVFAKKPGASSAKAGTVVEVIGPIPDSLDANAVAELSSASGKVKDYNSPVDLSGLGNANPFGQ